MKIQKEFFIFICLTNIVLIGLGISSFTWGKARIKGIEYFWYLVFSIILYYGLFVCIFQLFEVIYLDMPFTLSLFIAISPFILMTVAFLLYKFTASDEVQYGTYSFLILLFLGQSIAIQVEKPLAYELIENSPKVIEKITSALEKTPYLSDEVKYLKGKYPILTKSTIEIGKNGEYITNRLITSQGYEKILSKYQGNQGIDHIFAKYDLQGAIKKVQIVETKVNTSQLKQNQMTNQGILFRIDKLLNRNDLSFKEKEVYLFIKNNIDNNYVVKQLYNHNYLNNLTTISKLGVNQEIINTSKFQNPIIAEVFK
ncbi:MAG: hypothetical protein NTW25_03810 [Candidatus Kapabacteria bacterium]|nr:hypothetical protein [Candidatus Kapabacteria bacterium]